MGKNMETDVLIIGGGVAGTAIARELSKYNLKTILVEKGYALANGQTKLSTASIYTGLVMIGSLIAKSVLLKPGEPLYDPNGFKMEWCEMGFKEWPKIFEELDVKYIRLPTLVFARNKKELEDLDYYEKVAHQMGGEYENCYRSVEGDELFELEPNLTKDAIKGLYDKDHLIDAFPPELVTALAENAKQNGVDVILDAEVTNISQQNAHHIVETKQGNIETNYIINCAGGNADKIAQMGGGCDFKFNLKTSTLMIFDRNKTHLINGMVRPPCEPGFLAFVKPNAHGNLMGTYGHYDTVDHPEDTEIILEQGIKGAEGVNGFVPSLSRKDVINLWRGVRCFSNKEPDDYLVEFSPFNEKMINIVLRAPGIAGSLGLSRHIPKMLSEAGLKLEKKSNFNPRRKAIPRFRDLSYDERNELIQKDPKYGHVICRCETVTEGEIVEAIKRGAISEQGVKFRTRAGMGRCKRGFCGPRVIEILARELNIPVTEVVKRSYNSVLIPYKAKELLLEKEEALVK
jgi:glycerol-3-phosphate dehydrogenase